MNPTITITTGARLHFGPLSYRPPEGRHFGGVGVMIDEPGFRVTLREAKCDCARTGGPEPDADRVREVMSQYRRSCPAASQPPPCEIILESEVPSHSGLGSGTQLGLAVACGLSLLAGESHVPVTDLARRVGRGRRSAVGIYGFAEGGLIVDAGQFPTDDVGALACRVAMPSAWRALLITPAWSDAGLSGNREERAFAALEPMPAALTDRLCRIVLTNLLPAVQMSSFADFCRAVDAYGRLVGEYFAAVQGGVFGHPRTDALVDRLGRLGLTGVGQSSWGPTVYAFASSDEVARQLLPELGDETSARIVGFKNTGAAVEIPAQPVCSGHNQSVDTS